jgi:hypothetical protein
MRPSTPPFSLSCWFHLITFLTSISPGLMLAILLMASPVSAQQPSPSPPPARPQAAATSEATQDDMNTYFIMGAINLCMLSQQKVLLQPALDANVSMIGSVLAEKHGSRIAGVQGARSQQQIINVTYVNLILASDKMCGPKLPTDWRKEYDRILAEIRKRAPKTTP